jgi:hypothetical protein
MFPDLDLGSDASAAPIKQQLDERADSDKDVIGNDVALERFPVFVNREDSHRSANKIL